MNLKSPSTSLFLLSSFGGPSNLRRIAAFAGALLIASAASAVQVAVTIRNAAPENAGEAVNGAIEAASEDGNVSMLTGWFNTSQPNGEGAVIPGPVGPGRTFTQIFDLDAANLNHSFLSYFAMVIPSNDAFWANDNPSAYPIFDGAGTFIPRSFKIYGSMIWDAGTEVNDENGANTAFLAQAAPNTGTTQNGVAALHAGFMAAGQGGIIDQVLTRFGGPLSFAGADFKQAMYPVAEITVSLVSNSTSSFPPFPSNETRAV